MSTAIVNTKSGGAFRLNNATMVGMDHILYDLTKVYEIQDGDNIRFVS